MKMTAALRLAAWAAWAALAAAQLASPNGDRLPVPQGWHVVEFTKGPDSLPKSGEIASPEPAAVSSEPSTASQAVPTDQVSSSGNVDGLQIPPGYSIEAFTPGVDSPPAAPLSVASLPEPSQPSPIASEAGSSGSADGLQIPPGYRIEALTPGAGSTPAASLTAASPPAEPLVLPSASPPAPLAPQPVVAAADLVVPQPTGVPSKEPVAAQDLKVDGLDVPAGWKVTSVIGDDSGSASDSRPPPATAKAAVAKLAPMPAVATASVSIKEEHKLATASADSVSRKPSEPTETKSMPWANAAVASAPVKPRTPVATEGEAVPIGAITAATPTTEAAVDNVLSYATGQKEQAAVPFVPSETLQRITSVECLTETIHNDGRPCNGRKVSPAASSPPLPTQIISSLTSGAQHLMQQMGLYPAEVSPPSIPLSVVPLPPAKAHAHLRKHREDHVTRVIEVEDTPASLQIQEVEVHDEKPDEMQKSMADLVSSSE